MSVSVIDPWTETPFHDGQDAEVKWWPWSIENSYKTRAANWISERIYTKAIQTPDIRALSKFSTHVLAVYGTLKKGYSAAKMLEKCPKFCCAMSEREAVMLETPAPKRFPLLFSDDVFRYKRKRYFVELYLVPTSTLVSLDTYEQNGRMYNRVMAPYQVLGKECIKVPAWTYFANPSFWQNDLDQHKFTPSVFFTKNKEPRYEYYFFSKNVSEKR